MALLPHSEGNKVRHVSIPPLACWDCGFESHRGAWMSVCYGCCVLPCRGLCDELITRPEESYRLWCVAVCDLENLMNEEAMARVGPQCPPPKKNVSLPVLIPKHFPPLTTRIQVRSVRFWDFSQPIMVVPYRRFGTTYVSHLQGLSSLFLLTLEDRNHRLSRDVGAELPL